MSVLLSTAGSVAPVEIHEQWSAPGGTAINAGQPVYYQASTGWALPAGTLNPPTGIAITTTTYNGQAVTAVRKGLIDLGGTTLASTTFGQPIYSQAGVIGTAPTAGGTFQVGSVVPAFSSHSGATGGTLTTDRLLRVNL